MLCYFAGMGQRVRVVDIMSEIQLNTTRSSGPGGQHVNKVETKVVLRWDVNNSSVLEEDQRALILTSLANKLTKDGVLIITAESKRSQLQNKEITLTKLDKVLAKVFAVVKKRRTTKPSRSAIAKRIKSKKKQGEKKKWRQKPE